LFCISLNKHPRGAKSDKVFADFVAGFRRVNHRREYQRVFPWQHFIVRVTPHRSLKEPSRLREMVLVAFAKADWEDRSKPSPKSGYQFSCAHRGLLCSDATRIDFSVKEKDGVSLAACADSGALICLHSPL
jgi:hypothetical protein